MATLSSIRNDVQRARATVGATTDGAANAVRQLADAVTKLIAYVEDLEIRAI
jgi:hypothetical protein